MIYIGSFYIHFSILTRSGPGESYLAMQTQNEMKGYAPIDTPRRKWIPQAKKKKRNTYIIIM